MDNNNNKTDWSKRDVGALWKRESTTQKYLSGYVKVDELGIERELKVVVFSNKNKKDNPKAPDYRIYLSLPQKAEEKSVASVRATPLTEEKKGAVKQTKATAAVSKVAEQESGPNEEDIL